MNNFKMLRPENFKEYSIAQKTVFGSKLPFAGGTDALDLLKERILQPDYVVNLKRMADLRGIQKEKNHVRIGATTTIAELAGHPVIREKFPGLQQAAESIATPQIRNMGTVGGNLAQRPRCWYFRGETYHCLKKGGGMCYAYVGLNKYHAILGGGPCFIVHPSDLAPMLIALNATVHLLNAEGKRRKLALKDFFQLPAQNLFSETVLQEGEIITHVDVPIPQAGNKNLYIKFKERETADFALVSVALSLNMRGNTIKSGQVVLGGVAPVPWVVKEAESLLNGARLTEALAEKVAQAAVQRAQPLSQNKYKILLTQNIIKRAFRLITEA